MKHPEKLKLLRFLLAFTVAATAAEAEARRGIAPYITTVTSFLVAEQMWTKTLQTLQQSDYYFRKAAAKFVF